MSARRTVLIQLESIVDSSDGQASAWTRALRNGGYEVSFAEVRERIGMGCDRLLQDLSGLSPGSAAAPRIVADRRHLFHSLHLANVTIHPGGRDLIARLHRAGYTLVLTSACDCDLTEQRELLEHVSLRDAFDEILTRPNSARCKPAPDTRWAGSERGRTPVSECLLLGDTPYDVAAARDAGVASIALESGGWPADALGGAVAIYRDPLDLLRNFELSPLARSPLYDRCMQRSFAEMPSHFP